jgi:hypothetical protein
VQPPAVPDPQPIAVEQPQPLPPPAPRARTIKAPTKAAVTAIRGNHGLYTSKPRRPYDHQPSVDEIAELGRALLDSAFGIGKPRR